MTEHRYRMDIEQWGPRKWYGNVVHQQRGYDSLTGITHADWSIGSEYGLGWSRWSRKALERKLRKVIERDRKRDEWNDQHPAEEIVA